MTVLVVGANGATGQHLVEQLLIRGQSVRAMMRWHSLSDGESPHPYFETLQKYDGLSIIYASISELSDIELAQHVSGCDAIASCLGHTLSVNGIFGQPRRLVTDATHQLCQTIKADRPETPVKFVLMNTAGNRNQDLNEPISFSQKCVIGLIRLLIPPHADNEEAANYLRVQMGQDDSNVEWSAVRPDSLIDEAQVSEYEVYSSPTRSAIFNAGETSRINVARFMAELITNDDTWRQWKGKMPVIYNKSQAS